MRRCSSGHDNAEDQRFCGQCGERLDQGTVLTREHDPGGTRATEREEAVALDAESDGRGRGRRGLALLGAALIVAGVGSGSWMLRPDVDERYLAALEDAGLRDEFSTQRAAVVNAEKVCDRLDDGAEAEGSRADRIGVEHYCPEYADDFRVLRTIEVTGRFTVFDYDSFGHLSEGDECFSGDGGYGDITTTTPVLLTNIQGDVLHRTELGVGVAAAGSCTYEFTLPVTEGEDGYVVAIGDRGESTYTFEEIQTASSLHFTLGDITDALGPDLDLDLGDF